jgi:outer membrane protein OmpA-like peptidoglycan-associated protein
MPGATVKLLDMGMNIIAEQIVQQDARYSFPEEVECGQAYYLITENGLAYSIAETTFVAPTTSQSVSVDMEIETFSQDCPPYDLGCLLGLNPIYFDLNKYFIRPDAEIELTKVFNAMIRFPELIVRIESHTDSRSPQSYNLRLSQNRATSTRNWLIQRGISPSRLSAVGYGESQLINRCADGVPCTEAEHQLNRRSMFIIENYQMLPTSRTSTPTRPTQAYSQAPRPVVNPPTTVAVPSPVSPTTVPRTQNTPPTRPTPVVPPVRVSTPPSVIPPIVASAPPVMTAPPTQNIPQNQEEPAAIVIQVRPNPTPQSQNTQQPPVRSAEEALQILENHRNQSEEIIPKTAQPPAPPQTIVIQVKPKYKTEEDSKTVPKTSPPVRSAEEALQILQNHRNKTQAANSKPPKPTPAIASANTIIQPVNLPNEKSPVDTLDAIVAKLKAKQNSSSSFNTQKALADADIVYVVQIAALINRRDVNHKVFRGLSGLSTEKFREFHRYLYRPSASYQQAKIAQRHVISKGFTKAFIVAYVNGARTSAWEVAKLNNQN